MSNPRTLDQDPVSGPEISPTAEPQESFGAILSQYEQAHARPDTGSKGLLGTVVAVSGDTVFLDIGYKSEGTISLAAFDPAEAAELKPGVKIAVSSKGRGPDGYYELSKLKVERPKDWTSLEKAFAEKTAIAGTVSGVIKGGLTVDVGVRAFMPASRSGAHDQAEMEKLVGQEIQCRLIKVDVADEDVVVDRRAVLEEEELKSRQSRFAELKEGETVRGTVCSLTDYGAFVDIGGGIDGLLHVADISWSRVEKPADVLSAGQEIEARILKVDSGKHRVSLGMKQLQPHPWDAAGDKFKTGERVRGTVTRVTDFGAFVELEPGVEGLIHLSEMSWSRKVRKPSDVVKPGDQVEVAVLGLNLADRRISLGLKQALGDPWDEVPKRFPAGTVVEAPVVSIQKFGAFVQLADGVEGMIHVADIAADKRINHPQEVLKEGQAVRAVVLDVDIAKRRLRLGMKQLIPTSLDEYIAEHKPGDAVTGRVTDVSQGRARVELGEGIQATCKLGKPEASPDAPAEAKADLGSLTSMLEAKWKGSGVAAVAGRGDAPRTGQIRGFRITELDPAAKRIELELAD
jgi:small subunit ribosomal protein S1